MLYIPYNNLLLIPTNTFHDPQQTLQELDGPLHLIHDNQQEGQMSERMKLEWYFKTISYSLFIPNWIFLTAECNQSTTGTKNSHWKTDHLNKEQVSVVNNYTHHTISHVVVISGLETLTGQKDQRWK